MAKTGTRVMSLILAIIFFLSTVAVSVGVIALIRQDENQRKQEEAVLKQIQEQQTQQQNGQTAEDTTNPENGDGMQGKPMANFQPIENVETLQAIDLVEGTGEEVKAGATVTAHYTGAVAATGIVFQSSHDQPGDQPVAFSLDGVIPGWTKGVPGMKVGGTRRLLIPSAEAYGSTPPQGSGIPADADLVFDIELTAVQNK